MCCFAAGIIIRSSLAGENTDFGFFTSLTVSFCYFVAGQLLLLFSVALIQVTLRCASSSWFMSPFDIEHFSVADQVR